MRHALRTLLLLLFLLVQIGGLVHGVQHALEPADNDGPMCELCLAYTPLGTGIVGNLPTWQATMPAPAFPALLPVASPTGFRATYRSRAPPLTC